MASDSKMTNTVSTFILLISGITGLSLSGCIVHNSLKITKNKSWIKKLHLH